MESNLSPFKLEFEIGSNLKNMCDVLLDSTPSRRFAFIRNNPTKVGGYRKSFGRERDMEMNNKRIKEKEEKENGDMKKCQYS